MKARWLRYRERVELEIVLAFAVSAGAFVVAAVIGTAARGQVSPWIMGPLFIAVVLAIARFRGVVYAVPVGLVSLQAFDWYFLPPLRALDGATVFVLAVSILVAILVAEVASHAGRRAAVSEEARGVLADEQAALRRVATLVARGVPPSELFGAVTGEAGRLLGADFAAMVRHEGDDTATVVATWAAVGDGAEPSGRSPLHDGDLAVTIARTARPARTDGGLRSSVGGPIVVEGRVWGSLLVQSANAEPLPPDTESRLENFTELLATATGNAQARAEVRRLADEQAALRRVATLVAQEAAPAEVFAAVADALAQLVGVEDLMMHRFEDDGSATIAAVRGELGGAMPVGTTHTLAGESVSSEVLRGGRSARMDEYAGARGPLAEDARTLGVRSAVGAPIMVDGRVWGVVIAVSRAEPLPADTESALEEFTQLIATAISNGQARSELAASRARIVAAADEERGRVVRDLHDGAQQRLVHTLLTLKLAQHALEQQSDDLSKFLNEALDQANRATVELRELSHGILPGVLKRGGLRAGVEALATRTPVPVENDVSVGRLPAAIEATAYFVVAEALTNVAKHARAQHAVVTARVEDGTLRVDVRDDGVGGARRDGSGLVGLGDRLAVLDGRLRIESPAEGGTLVAATIPLPGGTSHSMA
jgi:signal transduction histidine kinase